MKDSSEQVLTAVIDVIKADAERMGIRFPMGSAGPYVFYEGDGEDEDCPPPEGWRDLLAKEAQRLGWESLYV